MKTGRGSVYAWRQLASAGLGLEAGTQVAHTLAENHERWGIWTGATDREVSVDSSTIILRSPHGSPIPEPRLHALISIFQNTVEDSNPCLPSSAKPRPRSLQRVQQEVAAGRYTSASTLIEQLVRRFFDERQRGNVHSEALRRIGQAVDQAELYDRVLIPDTR